MQAKKNESPPHLEKRQAERQKKDSWRTKVFEQTAHSTTKLIALRIADYYNLDAMAAWPSQERLATDLSLSERQVRRGVAYLKLHGWLKVTSRRHDPSAKQRTNLYQLTFEFAPHQPRLKTQPKARAHVQPKPVPPAQITPPVPHLHPSPKEEAPMLNKVMLIGRLQGDCQYVVTGKSKEGELQYATRFWVKTNHLKVKKDGTQNYCEEVHTCVLHNVHPDDFKKDVKPNAKVQVEGMLCYRKRSHKQRETYISLRELNVLDAPALKSEPPPVHYKARGLPLPEEELSANPRQYLPKEEAAKRLREIQHQAKRAKYLKKNQLSSEEKQPAPVPLGQVLQQTIYREKSDD